MPDPQAANIMDHAKSLDEAFITQNAALAFTLRTCGCKHPENERGEIIPVKNTYDYGILRQYKDADGREIYAGKGIEEAVDLALKNGHPGHVTYCFQKSELLEKICKGFDAQKEANRAAAEGSETRHEFPVATLEVDPFDVARICCQFAATRKALGSAWQHVRAEIVIHGEYKSEDTAKGSRITGSFKQFSHKPSEATRRKLNLR